MFCALIDIQKRNKKKNGKTVLWEKSVIKKKKENMYMILHKNYLVVISC